MQFYKQETGHISNTSMWRAIVKHLSENGFTLISLNGSTSSTTITDNVTFSDAVLEATVKVDPLAATQPWRIKVSATSTGTVVNVATPKQISDLGVIAKMSKSYPAGALWTSSGEITAGTVAGTSGKGQFYSVDDFGLDDADAGAYPMSFHISVTDHGMAFMFWIEGKDNQGTNFSWFVIQRPVLQDGSIVQTGKAPLFCVYSIGGGGAATEGAEPSAGGIMRFVVREDDINTPTFPISAVTHRKDSAAIINSGQQVAITEDEEFVASFPNNLNTHRYKYPYELDMIGCTSADVISQFNETEIQQYNEGTKRLFKAMNSNGLNNTGMRVLFLIEDNKPKI